MLIPKCYIAQRKTGEIFAVSQLNSGDEWFCHHCQCPLVFHPPTITSQPWFEHDILQGQPETLLQCPYLAPVNGKPSAVAKLQRLLAQLPQSLQQPNGNARCAACHMAVRNAALNAEKGYTVGRYEFSDTYQAIMGLIGTPESYYMGVYNFGVKINHFLSSSLWCLWIRNSYP